MKRLLLIIIPVTIFVLSGCDKIGVDAYKPVIELDTSFFTDGNWEDYPWPEFNGSAQITRNVLLEDFTGHKCPNCPLGNVKAEEAEENHPDRVFAVSIHQGANNDNSLQVTLATCGDTIANPESEFCHDFITEEGVEIGSEFATGFGFNGNPSGTVNRIIFEGQNMFSFYTLWEDRVNTVLDTDPVVSLQTASNYFESSNGLYLHVEAEFLEPYETGVNIVTYVIENEIIAWQDSVGTNVEHYHHHNVFIGCIDGLAFGKSLGTTFTVENKISTDYSYKIPDGLTPDDIHFVTYVYDVETYEILQVVKHELNN